MDSPETWRWIWLVLSVLFLVGELATAGTFFLVCFAVGAALASVLAFLGVSVAWEWVAFLGGTAGAFAAFIPLRRRLDRALPQSGVGASRLVGETAVVTRPVTLGGTGLVRVGRELWTAESADGSALDLGAVVRVLEVRGTRAIVVPGPPDRADQALNPWEMP
jgi:membrane protein implicated in regulation of membrane protease activity